MDKIIITIETDNAAFDGYLGEETARILKELAAKLESGMQPTYLMDLNGNKCGSIEYLG